METILSYFTSPYQKEREQEERIEKANKLLSEIENRLTRIEFFLLNRRNEGQNEFIQLQLIPPEILDERPIFPFEF